MSSVSSSPSPTPPSSIALSGTLPTIDTVLLNTMSETITHIVLFKYKNDISWSDFEAHFASFMALKTKSLHPVTGAPLIKSLKAGKNRSWESFNKGMTHGFVLEFASQEDLDYYLTTESVHLQFSRDAKPLIEDSVVVDIKDGVLFGAPAEHPNLKVPGTRKGTCHCQGVKWTAKLDKAEHVLCHCSTCQKLGGGPYSCNQIIPREELSIVAGQENVGVYKYKGASGKFVSCYFCKTCTSHIYHHQDVMPEKVIVRTLLLDGGEKMPATGEIFAEGKLGWVQEIKNSLGN
ncbi:dabb-domain-containing protein [Aaosphaeria arxii CBS 175.79]|uniref:Dabb-domain-containing protein n=1 Tax=Aaosphaeria arxii CBS 175.79 TaxID=1450172 RepID=A0A6A5XYN3_9PLEO|nr:dabb-domain-containing protein [Aaosphaeria arxii CBS 175.79]KAF2018282.1 dabb-domain-containing protein [Aaosphaeria arxii CBS 175.79]